MSFRLLSNAAEGKQMTQIFSSRIPAAVFSRFGSRVACNRQYFVDNLNKGVCQWLVEYLRRTTLTLTGYLGKKEQRDLL